GQFEALGRKTQRLRVSHAFHSPRIDPMLDAFARVAAELTFHPPQIPLVSNLTGERATAELLASPDYWVRHARAPVRFLDGIRACAAQGATIWLRARPRLRMLAL